MRRYRTTECGVQDTRIVPVGTGDHGHLTDLTHRPVTEARGPLTGAANCFASLVGRNRLVTHERAMQAAGDRSQVGRKLNGLDEETVTIGEPIKQPSQLGFGKAVVHMGGCNNLHVNSTLE